MNIVKDVKENEYINKNIDELIISSRVIGNYAFYNSKIKKLILNEGIEFIGDKAFFNNETKDIILPTTIKRIGHFSFNQSNIIYQNNLIKGNVVNQYKDFIEIAKHIYKILPNFDFNKTSPEIVSNIYKNKELIKAYYYNLKKFNEIVKVLKTNFNISYINEYIVFKFCLIIGFFTKNMNNVYNFLCNYSKNYTVNDLINLVENIEELHYYPNLSNMLIENINNESFKKIFVNYYNNYKKINKTINRSKSYLINKSKIDKKYGRTYKNVTKKITAIDVLEFYKNQLNVREDCIELKEIVPIISAYINQEQFDKVEQILILSKQMNNNYFSVIEGKGTNFYYKWLSNSDPVNFIAGYLCDSCAQFGDIGEEIIIESMLNPLIKTMVIYFNDRIVAKTTCYYNPKCEYLILNTICVNKDFYKQLSADKKIFLLQDIIIGIKKQIEEMNKKGFTVKNVRVGTDYNTLTPQIKTLFFEETTNVYKNYPFESDNAKEKQVILIKEK